MAEQELRLRLRASLPTVFTETAEGASFAKALSTAAATNRAPRRAGTRFYPMETQKGGNDAEASQPRRGAVPAIHPRSLSATPSAVAEESKSKLRRLLRQCASQAARREVSRERSTGRFISYELVT